MSSGLEKVAFLGGADAPFEQILAYVGGPSPSGDKDTGGHRGTVDVRLGLVCRRHRMEQHQKLASTVSFSLAGVDAVQPRHRDRRAAQGGKLRRQPVVMRIVVTQIACKKKCVNAVRPQGHA